MQQDLIQFVQAMDRCWLESRFDDLADYLDEHVVMVAPGGEHRLNSLAAAIDSYRTFMGGSSVQRFHPSNYTVTERGNAAVIEYAWDMAWTGGDASHEAKGREILALSRGPTGWRVVWRMQIAN